MSELRTGNRMEERTVNPMYNELIDALRKILMYQDSEKRNICHDAADAIERLVAEVERLKELPSIRNALFREEYAKEYRARQDRCLNKLIEEMAFEPQSASAIMALSIVLNKWEGEDDERPTGE